MAPRRWREEEAIDRSVRGVADDRHTPEDVEGWIREHGEKMSGQCRARRVCASASSSSVRPARLGWPLLWGRGRPHAITSGCPPLAGPMRRILPWIFSFSIWFLIIRSVTPPCCAISGTVIAGFWRMSSMIFGELFGELFSEPPTSRRCTVAVKRQPSQIVGERRGPV